MLLERGLAPSREKAQALILAGEVTVDGQKAPKPGHSYPDDSQIEVKAELPFVSRGGVKLAAALDHWEIAVEGRVCLDVGSSTGGFVDCLLQRGALRVHSVDVGATQLAWKLQIDPRVKIHDRTNARTLSPETTGEPVSLAFADVSFISVTLLLSAIASVLQADGEMIILVKPQFEVERGEVGKGGIVRDPSLHDKACRRVAAAVQDLGFTTALLPSPILGTEGNREFLLYGRR